MIGIESKFSRGANRVASGFSHLMLTATAAVCLAVCVPANAGPPIAGATVVGKRAVPVDPSVPSKVVRFADLNLDADEGIRVLYRRIAGAAEEVCSAYATRRELSLMDGFHHCRDNAITNAVAEVGRPRLTLYLAQLRHEAAPGAMLASR